MIFDSGTKFIKHHLQQKQQKSSWFRKQKNNNNQNSRMPIWMFPKIGEKTSKWMVYNRSKPYEQLDDLGGFPIICWKHPSSGGWILSCLWFRSQRLQFVRWILWWSAVECSCVETELFRGCWKWCSWAIQTNLRRSTVWELLSISNIQIYIYISIYIYMHMHIYIYTFVFIVEHILLWIILVWDVMLPCFLVGRGGAGVICSFPTNSPCDLNIISWVHFPRSTNIIHSKTHPKKRNSSTYGHFRVRWNMFSLQVEICTNLLVTIVACGWNYVNLQ